MYFLNSILHTAWRGSPRKIEDLKVHEEDHARLLEAMKALGIDYETHKSKIGWWMASYTDY